MTKLLVLEHSKSVRNNLCERLDFEGYLTRAVENTAAATEALAQEQADVIIVDDAAEVPDTDAPFIVISSKSTFESAVEAVRRGAVDFLTKPIDMNRLLASIRSCVGESGEESV